MLNIICNMIFIGAMIFCSFHAGRAYELYKQCREELEEIKKEFEKDENHE